MYVSFGSSCCLDRWSCPADNCPRSLKVRRVCFHLCAADCSICSFSCAVACTSRHRFKGRCLLYIIGLCQKLLFVRSTSSNVPSPRSLIDVSEDSSCLSVVHPIIVAVFGNCPVMHYIDPHLARLDLPRENPAHGKGETPLLP